MPDPSVAELPAAGPIDVDVAVVGGGPAGIAAATSAAEARQRVVLLDEAPRPGGQIWRHTARGELPAPARHWLDRLDSSGARVLAGASVVDGTTDLQTVRLVVERAGPGAGTGGAVGPLVVRARAVVLATGARELFLPFPGWTLPGVLGVGGLQALLKAGAAVRGRRVVVAGTGPLLLPVAAALRRAGARVVLVAEQAPARRVARFALSLWRSPGRAAQAARYRAALAAPYRAGTWPLEARGGEAVHSVVLTDGRRRWSESCDLAAVGFGLVPAVELPRLLGCALRGEAVAVDPLQRTSVPGVFAAGEPTGIAGVDAALLEGRIAGLVAADRSAEARRFFPGRARQRAFGRRLAAGFALRQELRELARPDTIVCRCEDVPLERLRAFGSAREAKLMSRAGMGACQGRVCGAALRELFGWEHDTPRVPVVPAYAATFIHTRSDHAEP